MLQIASREMGVMRVVAAIIFLVTLTGWTDMRGTVRVEQASAGQPYDFAVHVRNIPDIGCNRRPLPHGGETTERAVQGCADCRRRQNKHGDMGNNQQFARLRCAGEVFVVPGRE
jgi:hypothetical protein